MQRLRLIKLVFIICTFLLLGATNTIKFTIKGVKGELLDNVSSRLKEWLPQNSIDEERKNVDAEIKAALTPYGYFKPYIKTYYNERKKHLRVYINPGPQIKINQIIFKIKGDGQNNQMLKCALEKFPLKEGDPFNSTKYEEAKEKIINTAEKNGYMRAAFKKAEVLIDLDRYTTVIKLTLATGAQYYFGGVRFTPTYIYPSLLYRYIPFCRGQPYSVKKVLDFESSLSSSGYFKSVHVKPKISDSQTVPIDVELKKIGRLDYDLSVGYGTDTGPRGRASVSMAPVNRMGHKFNAIIQGSQNQNAAGAQYLIPGPNPATDAYFLNGNLSNLDYNSGHSTGIMGSIGYQHVTRSFQSYYSLNILDERYRYSYQPNEHTTVFFPKATLTFRCAKNTTFPKNGYNVSFNGFVTSFQQATIDAKAAYMLEPITLRTYVHGMYGYTAINNINKLPLSLAMLLGGAPNMKAFSFNSIGPGRVMEYIGIELQKETVKNWYIIGFFDSGDVYNPSTRELLHDAGGGLMWVSPIGPIKVSIAQEVDDNFRRVPRRSPKLVVNMGPDL